VPERVAPARARQSGAVHALVHRNGVGNGAVSVLKEPPAQRRYDFLKTLEQTRRLATREGWRRQHVQSIIAAIDQYAEADRDFFLNKPPTSRQSKAGRLLLIGWGALRAGRTL